MRTPPSDSNPALIPAPAPSPPESSRSPSRADRKSTSMQVASVKSSPLTVLPENLTRCSFAPPKSTFRSTQSSNVTSVSFASRKLTESSLQPPKATRRSTHVNACTPASTHPLNQASVYSDSATSTATSRVCSNQTSVNLAFRSRPESNDPPMKADSVNRAPLPAAAPNVTPSNLTWS